MTYLDDGECAYPLLRGDAELMCDALIGLQLSLMTGKRELAESVFRERIRENRPEYSDASPDELADVLANLVHQLFYCLGAYDERPAHPIEPEPAADEEPTQPQSPSDLG